MVSKKQLTELGFNDKEARVYLALLELGPSTATEISALAKINRTTSYDILEFLASEGLISYSGQTKIKKFVAESPEKVIAFLENKINQGREQLKNAQLLLPELLSIYNIKEKPKVKFYEGIDKVKEAFEDTLTAKNDIVAYAVGADMFNTLGQEYFQDYFKKRVAKNIRVRVIAPNDTDSQSIVINNANEMRESVLVPKDMFYFSIETNIYNNKILTVSWKEKFAIIIESEEIANAQRKIFELSWLGAKTLQK